MTDDHRTPIDAAARPERSQRAAASHADASLIHRVRQTDRRPWMTREGEAKVSLAARSPRGL